MTHVVSSRKFGSLPAKAQAMHIHQVSMAHTARITSLPQSSWANACVSLMAAASMFKVVLDIL